MSSLLYQHPVQPPLAPTSFPLPRHSAPMEEAPPSEPAAAAAPSLSISQLVRLHRKERLLVHPIHWTDRHLELLGCSFDVSRAPSTAPPVLFGKQGSGHLRYAIQDRNWNLFFREGALCHLLARDGPFEDRFEPPPAWPSCPPFVSATDGFGRRGVRFSFDRRRVQTLRCIVFTLRPQQESDACPPIIVAYFGLERIDELRGDLFELPDEIQRCKSTYSLSCLKRKKITPKDRLRDPYIVTILIALAQENRRRAGHGNGLNLSLFTVRRQTMLLVFVANAPRYCSHKSWSRQATPKTYTCTGHSITSSFLCSLDDPSFVPSEPISIQIKITTLRYAPYRTFLDRFTTLVLSETALASLRKIKGGGLENESVLDDAGPRNLRRI